MRHHHELAQSLPLLTTAAVLVLGGGGLRVAIRAALERLTKRRKTE